MLGLFCLSSLTNAVFDCFGKVKTVLPLRTLYVWKGGGLCDERLCNPLLPRNSSRDGQKCGLPPFHSDTSFLLLYSSAPLSPSYLPGNPVLLICVGTFTLLFLKTVNFLALLPLSLPSGLPFLFVTLPHAKHYAVVECCPVSKGAGATCPMSHTSGSCTPRAALVGPCHAGVRVLPDHAALFTQAHSHAVAPAAPRELPCATGASGFWLTEHSRLGWAALSWPLRLGQAGKARGGRSSPEPLVAAAAGARGSSGQVGARGWC